jgi:hypothetical protein
MSLARRAMAAASAIALVLVDATAFAEAIPPSISVPPWQAGEQGCTPTNGPDITGAP